MQEHRKVKVTEKAVVARIRRKLASDGESLRRCRPNSRSYHELGDWYTTDDRIGAVIHKGINIAELAKELGVLKDWEEIDDE